MVSGIPDQTIAEGASFATINLDDYVSDVDNTAAEMSWTYSGWTDLTVSIDPNRVATITIPSSEWNGSETITFTATDPGLLSDSDPATFTVTAVNDPPVVVDDNYSVDEGDTLTVSAPGVLDNDSDPENNPLTAIWVSDPAYGTLTLNDDGSFTYVHDGSETTSDSFTYKANDGSLDSNVATVNITIIPIEQYTLTLNSTAGGSVTTPGEGTYTYDAGTVVSISATPASDYNFVNWTGDVGTVADVNAASTTITMNGNYTITANFRMKAKLEITKVANYVSGPNPPLVGATTTYDLVITVKNVGDNAARSVVVKDALPADVTYKSSSVSQGSLTLTGGSSITWSVGRLTGEADATATITVTVKPTVADAGSCITLNNGATGTGTDEPSGTSVSDGPTSPTVTLPVVQVILTIVKDGPVLADTGSTITYTITYGNIDTGDTTNVVISDVVPEDTTFVSATDGGTYDSATNIITWHIELIPTDTTGLAVNFDVKIDTDLPPGTTVITNQASMASYYGTELTDEALSNEVSTIVVVPFLEIDKSVNIPTAVTGDIITYTVKLTNISTHGEALDIEIRDKLPFGIVYISGSTSINGVLASDPSGSNPFSWPIDAIGPESTATITYRCAIGLNAVAGFHDNEATIRGYSVDGITLTFVDSPRAMARVKVVVFETKGIIIGKVFEDLNEDGWQDKGEPGIPGIDIVMEDGTTVTTDVDGKYSIPGVEPDYHVLTIDEATLPEGYEILAEVSKFVEVPEVGMAKLNFTVVKQEEGEKPKEIQVSS